MVYRPIREKSPDAINAQAKTLYENTGYDEISLSSLSISDYTELVGLTDELLAQQAVVYTPTQDIKSETAPIPRSILFPFITILLFRVCIILNPPS